MSVDDLMKQLEQARQIAIEDRKPTAMIPATMAQAKLLGLDGGMIDVTPQNEVKGGFMAIQTLSDLAKLPPHLWGYLITQD